MYRKREKTPTIITTKSRTQQNLHESTKIGSILKKYATTGIITHLNNAQPQYGDFSNYKGFQDNLNLVIEAQESFDSLPSEIRKYFQNSPQNLIDFISDESNRQKAEDLGLVPKKQTDDIKTIAKNDDKTTKTQIDTTSETN